MNASHRYTASSGALIVGTEAAITSGGTSGNVGSYYGTVGLDGTAPGFNWTVNSDGTNGLNQNLTFNDVKIGNANQLRISISVGAGSASLQRYYQICDFVSSDFVDNAEDGECRGGGWRTLNLMRSPITNTSWTTYNFVVYDGYWTQNNTSNTPVSTPVSNFFHSSGSIVLRAYSTSAVATTHFIDYADIIPLIDPTYYPAGAAINDVDETIINTYYPTKAIDNSYLIADGITSVDFYLSYKNIRSFTGMNTLVLSTNYSCRQTVFLTTPLIPYIYNFNTSSWDAFDSNGDLMICTTNESFRTVQVSKSISSNHISSGEVRIRYYSLNGTATNTQVKIDQSYIILGSVNADDTKCETSFGTNANSTTCVKTRVLNEITSPNNWQVTSELESATLAHDYYGNDFDSDSATGESAISMNLSFPYSPPSNASVVFLGYALRYKSNSGSLTLQPQFKDNQGDNPTISGGWTNLSTANTSTTETYADHTTTGYFTNDPSDYYNQTNGLANLRFRTSASTTSSSVTAEVDFAMFTYSWIEDNQSIVTLQSHYQATGGQIGQGGTNNTIVANTTSGNTGSYKGTLAQDTTSPGYNWTVTNGTTINPGLDQQLFFDGVNLNGANKFQIVIRASSSNAALTRAYQICDWVSTTNIDVAADMYCTGGGWRTLNIRKANITTTTMTNFTWHIFNGYWTTSTTSNTPVSTPLANFVNTSNGNRVLIRAYSNYGTAAYTHTIDFARVTPLIDSTYMASSFTQLTGGTVTTSYINTNNGTLTGQSAADDVYLTVPGTASAISSFYTSYGGIKTYTGMNAIVVVSRYNCSTTGINITPKIYNFTTSSWENLTSATIACSTTIATNYFSITGTISNYISGSSVRIGWFGSANSTVSIRIDMQYIMLGSVNADTSTCGITFGTGTVADCKNTNDIDSASGTPNVWRITTEAESTSMSHAYYGLDNDGDATSLEHATSGRMKFPITLPNNISPVYALFSTRFTSGTSAFTVGPQFESRGFGNGWVTFSSTSTGSYVYSDSIISNSIYSPNNYLDTSSNLLALRIRTSASTLTTSSATNIDFMMVSLSWSEGPSPTIDQSNFRVFNSLNSTDVGIPLASQNATATLLDDGQIFRIRMFLDVDTAQLPINSIFTLQFASKGAGTCASPSGMWTDVGTTSAIAYYNGTPADGATITVNAYDPTSTRTINYQTYEELNSVSNTKSAIPAGQTGMWDYSLIDYSAPANTTYCFRLLDAYTTAGSPTYSNYPSIKTPRGNPPDDPGKLEQTETSSNLSIMEGGWIDTQSVRYSATSYDPDGPLDTVYLCYERQLISVPFTYVDTACSSGFPGDSSYIYVVDSSIPANSEYHWQVRIKDAHSNYSAWVSFGTNLETARDFGIDITAPTALSVYDGTSAGIDVMFNDGSLSSLSGNWANVNADISGLKEYLYSIGTTPGSSDIKTMTNVSLATSATATGLTLKSSQIYYFNVFVNDNAGNQAVFSSDGQRVQPTLSFSLSNYSVIFDNLNAANDLTNTQATVITTSTNAYNGYRIRLWQWEDLASIENPSITIAPFDGGDYSAPAEWTVSNYGFGYHSSDTLVSGVDKFNPVTCAGGGTAPCYSSFKTVSPGDIVADNTVNVTGTPIINEQFTITYKIRVPSSQPAGKYSTVLVYTVEAMF